MPSAFANAPALQAYSDRVCHAMQAVMDYDTGAGTGELARTLSAMQRDFRAQGEAVDDAQIGQTGFSFQDLRAFILEQTRGEGLTIPVRQHPRAIARANARFKNAEVDFIHFVAAPDVTELPAVEQPLNAHAEKYTRFVKARLGVSIAVAAGGGVAGGGFTPPSLTGAATAAGLEFQFAKLSRHWAKFWDRWGFAGNVAVNAGYGVVISLTQTAAEAAFGMPLSLNLQEFMVKSLLIGTTTFVASFGAMQIAASRMLQHGEFSEYGRFRLENYSVFWNSFGRVLALSAAGLGAQYEVGQLYGVKFGIGELVGWGIQLAYLTAVTSPIWLKLAWGDAAYDRVTAYQLAHRHDPAHPWNRGAWGRVRKACAFSLAYLADLYTPRRVALK